MKTIKYALLAGVAGLVTCTLLTARPAFAQDMREGLYFSFGAGATQSQDSNVDMRIPLTTPARSRDATFDLGYMLSGAVGYRWDSGFRTELEGNYRAAGVNDLDTAAATGHQQVIGVMTNLLYDLGNSDTFRPYIGAGVGVAWNKWKNVQGSASPAFPFGTALFNDRDKAALQWQAIGGLSHPFTDHVDGFVEYRYIGLQNNKFQSTPPGSTISRHSDRSHNLLVGIRFNFGTEPKQEIATAAAAPPPPPPPPAPPPPAPPPPAPPPPPPVPQKFLVFFDFDKSSIRADAQKIVAEAADFAKKNGKARITATGHADTAGPAPYNMALSERRAKAVKAALLKMGFKEDEIVVMYKGESEPLIATGDGVKEPQNRRVEIVME
jgi:outer membrane protein OmpA-like peptidoglycan-associated protein/outer membrane protein W